jgi:phosphatidylserine/phosphatidylglycerophosphate/cardiolipin synthase-like enzyme
MHSKKGSWLITQPDDGMAPLLEAIGKAKTRIEILIFRFDRPEIERALIEAVERGVAVQALIAWTNHGGEQTLRQLETRLLAAGVTVARTASDLPRYHGKMIIVDRKILYVLGFNFTALDINRSRSFGVALTSRRLIAEAARLFEADSNRQPYSTTSKSFLVSPVNAREGLAAFIQGAKKEILIYDPCVKDRQMLRLLDERARAGARIRILGMLKRPVESMESHPLPQIRLHTRTIVRDRSEVFVGSQSLRAAELDDRREVGVIVDDARVVSAIRRTFESDWKEAEAAKESATVPLSGDKLAKKVAKAISKELPPVSEVIENLAEEMPAAVNLEGVNLEALEDTIRSAVKVVVKDSIQEAASKTPAPA